ncbi:MAG: Peptidyl-prolyl cis-trans isomerase [Bacteroidota bacterium]|jgi:peptidyl-prolyl cis-trans isomerase B (cyclophilin B)
MRILLVFALLLTGLTACTSNANSSTNNSNNPMELTRQIPNPKNVARPQFLMKVTQSGKELGEILLELCPDIAPKHVANFEKLVADGSYNGTAFHRVIPNFMIQGGDPNSKNKPRNTWGMGDPSQTTVPAEFNETHHGRGILSAARTPDPNSATSQFFICVADAGFLDRQYTVYGEVLKGMDVADKIVNSKRDGADNPLEKIEMTITKVTK